MPIFDPKLVRIMGSTLKIIGTSVGNNRGYFGNLRIALWEKKLSGTPSYGTSYYYNCMGTIAIILYYTTAVAKVAILLISCILLHPKFLLTKDEIFLP